MTRGVLQEDKDRQRERESDIRDGNTEVGTIFYKNARIRIMKVTQILTNVKASRTTTKLYRYIYIVLIKCTPIESQ